MANCPFVINVKGGEKLDEIAINDKGGDWWIWLSMIVINDKINDKGEVWWHDMNPKQASKKVCGWKEMKKNKDIGCGN